ncbi:hypothetical protein VTJ04DRAFT_7263 [Mycothermus thermophilus]|uniref:uncharacterized protein n=1 Tax=Humicola insolens TaxID=85995 RepID=UPI0037449A84
MQLTKALFLAATLAAGVLAAPAPAPEAAPEPAPEAAPKAAPYEYIPDEIIGIDQPGRPSGPRPTPSPANPAPSPTPSSGGLPWSGYISQWQCWSDCRWECTWFNTRPEDCNPGCIHTCMLTRCWDFRPSFSCSIAP